MTNLEFNRVGQAEFNFAYDIFTVKAKDPHSVFLPMELRNEQSLLQLLELAIWIKLGDINFANVTGDEITTATDVIRPYFYSFNVSVFAYKNEEAGNVSVQFKAFNRVLNCHQMARIF